MYNILQQLYIWNLIKLRKSIQMRKMKTKKVDNEYCQPFLTLFFPLLHLDTLVCLKKKQNCNLVLNKLKKFNFDLEIKITIKT